MLFSATLDNAAGVLVRRFLNDPAEHSVDSAATPSVIVHHLLTVAAPDRVTVVAALASGDKRSLVFTRTKRGAQRLARQLNAARIPAAQLHGDLSQNVRARNLRSFATGSVRVMVATDIAARGIHVDGIDLVIHADPPVEHKAYLHRSGRTARAGADGVVITLQTPAQASEVRALMRRAGVAPLAATVRPGSALLRSICSAARTRRAGARRHGQPGHRPRRRRPVGRLPSPGTALTPCRSAPNLLFSSYRSLFQCSSMRSSGWHSKA
jgi:superfamily II DNA/RNA helicase